MHRNPVSMFSITKPSWNSHGRRTAKPNGSLIGLHELVCLSCFSKGPKCITNRTSANNI